MTRRDIGLALFVIAAWGFGFAITKPTAERFPTIFLMAVSFAATAVIVGAAFRQPAATGHVRAAAIALFAVTLQAALIFKGLEGLDASVAILAAQTQVPFAILAAWALRTEPFAPGKLGPIGLALVGVAIVGGWPAAPPDPVSLSLLLCGAAAWGLGQALIARLGKDDGPVLLKRVAAHGAVQLAVISVFVETGQGAAIGLATPLEWAGLAFIALVGFALAYVVWFGLMRRNPVSSVAPFILLMPAVTIVTSVVMLGERPAPVTLAGGALILLGVALSTGAVTWPRRRTA